MGMLLGCKGHFQLFGTRNKDGYAEVEGVRVASVEGVPECARIVVESPRARENKYLLWHYYADSIDGIQKGGKGWHEIIGGARALNMALFVGMVDFFGGKVDFNDCDSSEVDYSVKPKESIWGHKFSPEDNALWDEMQYKILAVKPLTVADIAKYVDNAYRN